MRFGPLDWHHIAGWISIIGGAIWLAFSVWYSRRRWVAISTAKKAAITPTPLENITDAQRISYRSRIYKLIDPLESALSQIHDLTAQRRAMADALKRAGITNPFEQATTPIIPTIETGTIEDCNYIPTLYEGWQEFRDVASKINDMNYHITKFNTVEGADFYRAGDIMRLSRQEIPTILQKIREQTPERIP